MNRPAMEGLRLNVPAYVKHDRLVSWVAEIAALTQAADVYWCDGSQAEYDRLCEQLVAAGTFKRLNPGQARRTATWPAPTRATSRASRTAPSSAREARKTPARPTTGWRPARDAQTHRCSRPVRRLHARPHDVRRAVLAWARWARRSRTSASSCPTRPYVAVNMRIMTRMGRGVLRRAGRPTASSCPACTPWARRWRRARRTCAWPCNKTKYIVHFPETREIWSYGSGYGGNALLGKKCFALRIASNMGRDEGWLAEHMLILGVDQPAGREDLRRGGVPQRLRQDQLRDADPAGRHSTGWKVTTIGDDIAWIKPGADGRSDAINPEAGYFGVAPGHQRADQPELHGQPRRANAIFTNVGADRRRRRLVGRHEREPPAHCIDWQGKDWTPAIARRPAPRPRTRTRASPSPPPTTRRSTRPGTTRRACRSTPSSSAAAARPRCRW